MDEEEILAELEAQLLGRKIISLAVTPGRPIEVETDGLSADTVVATLLRALVFIVLDDYMDDVPEDEEEDSE